MNMKYDFDQVIDRSKNRAAKYDERMKKFGTEDVIPLWVADMDFRTAQPIIDACRKKAEEGIWGYTSRPDSYFEAVKSWEKRRNNWEERLCQRKLAKTCLEKTEIRRKCDACWFPFGAGDGRYRDRQQRKFRF